ncbi:MAG: hypothetical protein BWY21_02221 [Parcubacteria group bacterium ADurb.Bin216]|nr:MAG: hypothetical protein BWY21_02221 [Parcubacteria group bacterium ADurb.Bin216]
MIIVPILRDLFMVEIMNQTLLQDLLLPSNMLMAKRELEMVLRYCPTDLLD